MKIKEINASSIITKSNLPDADYVINPYVGCTYACIYCYARFMKRFTGHTEPWGQFLDIKVNASELIPDKTEKYKEFFKNNKNEIVSQECRKQLINELVQVKEIEIRREYEANEQYKNQEYAAVKKEIEEALLSKKSTEFTNTATNVLKEKHTVKYNNELIAEIAQGLEKIR